MELKFLGVLWGILMISQDLNTYYLYILLLITSQNVIMCDNFLDYYTLFVFINTIASGIFYPISGWITDVTANKSALVFLVSNIIQLVFMSLQILPYFFSVFSNNGWIALCVFWQLAQLVSIQNGNSLWKLIKQITDKESKNNLQLVNSIGNIGDLTSDVTETLTLSILAILILFVKSNIINYMFILIYLFAAIILLNLILCITSIYLFTSTRNDIGNNIGNDIIIVNVNDEIKKVKMLPHKWLYNSIKNFYKHRIAFHAFWHCILLGVYSTLVQYPLSLIEVNIIGVSSNKTLNNLCGGILTNLLLLGATTNLCYLIGSISYRLFVVNASPIRFYRWYYPVGSLLLLGITTALWFKIYYIVTVILISFATMIPYYLTYYDYFLFTEQSQGKSYGFILGLYGTINTIITASIQSLYYIGIHFGVILGVSIVLLILSIIYSYYLAYAVNKKQMEEVRIVEPLISVF